MAKEETIEPAGITIGVAGYLEAKDNGFWRLLAQPFRKPQWYGKEIAELRGNQQQADRKAFMAE